MADGALIEAAPAAPRLENPGARGQTAFERLLGKSMPRRRGRFLIKFPKVLGSLRGWSRTRCSLVSAEPTTRGTSQING